MVVPVGERYQQTLYILRKENGKLIKEALRPTLFVPMTGEAEDRRDVKPDPKNPRAINGNFEIPPLENGFIIGWYYQRQVTSTRKRLPNRRDYFLRQGSQNHYPCHDGQVHRHIGLAQR